MQQDFRAQQRRLPHWHLAGAAYFITWRVRRTQPDLSPSERTVVADAVRHFDGQRYELLAYVVMNDHVHVVAALQPDRPLDVVVHSWKSYTTHALQRGGRQGRVWQAEYFDRVIRDEAELWEKVGYILNNPLKRWPGVEHYPWVWARDVSNP